MCVCVFAKLNREQRGLGERWLNEFSFTLWTRRSGPTHSSPTSSTKWNVKLESADWLIDSISDDRHWKTDWKTTVLKVGFKLNGFGRRTVLTLEQEPETWMRHTQKRMIICSHTLTQMPIAKFVNVIPLLLLELFFSLWLVGQIVDHWTKEREFVLTLLCVSEWMNSKSTTNRSDWVVHHRVNWPFWRRRLKNNP